MINRAIYLIGASGHAKVIADILQAQGRSIASVFDRSQVIDQMLGYKVFAQPEDAWPDNGDYLIAVGNNAIRKRLAEQLNALDFTVAVHPSAVVSSYAQLGKGTVVMAAAVINVDVQVGKHAIINTTCSIDHECVIGDFVHISPQVGLAGNVEVGEGTHIGIGASVIQGIKIGKWVTVGAGAVIIKDVPDYAVVVGNPGRIIKYNKPSI